MFTMSWESSELEGMLNALDRETQDTIEDKHEQVEDILDEVQDQVRFLHELHQELDRNE